MNYTILILIKKYILISPDAGAVKRTLKFARILGLNLLCTKKEIIQNLVLFQNQ